MADKKFDIAELNTVKACDKGAELELLHPVTSEPLGIFIKVLGKDSTVFRDHIRDSVNDRIRREQMARKRGKDIEPTTVEKAESEAVDLLVLCTLGWRNMIMNGEAVEFNVPNARRIYTEYPWIRKQVDDGVANLELFMGN
ncbi:hypothetical protein [Immundisolibacter sp.]